MNTRSIVLLCDINVVSSLDLTNFKPFCLDYSQRLHQQKLKWNLVRFYLLWVATALL